LSKGQPKRSKIDLYSTILEVVRRHPGGGRITRISYGVGVPIDRLRDMLEDLTAYGLLRRYEQEGETRYMATVRGLEFLETYWKMNAYLETFQEAPARGMAAIMFTDISGFTMMTQRDEHRALRLLSEHQTSVREVLPRFHGREVKTIGDAFMVEFGSALEACLCAVQIQKTLHERNASCQEGDRLEVRIGIHVGDVERKGPDIFGDSVNIANRIQGLAEPASVFISRQVFDQVWNKLGQRIVQVGNLKAKNIENPLEVYAIELPFASLGPGAAPKR
jgi:class 3 adenylate cyclase